MDVVKDVAQIIYFLTLSIAGPLALLQYFKAKDRDKRANEYKVYDELNNRFFEYQKIALEYYDLDILDVPNNDPSLAFDKKRKQEMVAYSILFPVRTGILNVPPAGRIVPTPPMVRLETLLDGFSQKRCGSHGMAVQQRGL